MTIAEVFDFSFRRIGQKNDGEPYYAVGTLRMEPLLTEAVEYAVGVPEMAFAGPVLPSFAEAVGAGIKEYAAENGIVGLRVTLTAIEANDAGSSDYWFQAAAQSALEDAIKAHGVFTRPVTIREAFDLPFRLINQAAGAERWAQGKLRLEPIPTFTLEYAVAVSDDPPLEPYFSVSTEDVPYFSAAVSKGVHRAAQEQGLVGVRVILTEIQAHPVDSENRAYEVAAFRAVHAAIEAHGVPIPSKEKAQDRQKPQDSGGVPTTPKRARHTKETLKPVLVMLAGFLICGSLAAYEWHTRLQSGYYYPKTSFFAAAFAFGFAVLFIVGILFPEQTTARSAPPSPEKRLARAKAIQWKLGAFLAVCLLAGLLNLFLLNR